MQLPNKLYSYQKSTLAYLPRVLNEIKSGNSNVKDIFHAISEELDDPTDFLSIMDCLYALNAIEMSNEGEVKLCLWKCGLQYLRNTEKFGNQSASTMG